MKKKHKGLQRTRIEDIVVSSRTTCMSCLTQRKCKLKSLSMMSEIGDSLKPISSTLSVAHMQLYTGCNDKKHPAKKVITAAPSQRLCLALQLLHRPACVPLVASTSLDACHRAQLLSRRPLPC